ncbi:MAG TPA: hypothetical protein PLO67_02330 [Saprospiraceae bacterium]|mgnify:CR=1 FL=1|nr:hypothetical protein [Saprospiraceae bacterium]HPI04906.1 hypothetical protein [Saprospiraceae bacterium]
MKNTFDFRRFVQVCRLTWQTQPVLPYIILLSAIPLIFLFFFDDARGGFVSLRNEAPLVLFAVCMWGCGWLYAGLAFHELGNTGSANRYLMVPASTLEKWLAKSLLVFFVFPLIIWVAYNIVFQIFGLFSVRWFAFEYAPVNWYSLEVKTALFFFYLGLPVAYAAGVVWKRFGVLKGLVFICVLFFVLIQVISIGAGQYFLNSGRGMLLSEVSPPFYGSDADAGTLGLINIFWLLAAYVPSALLLASTYFFIKERTL